MNERWDAERVKQVVATRTRLQQINNQTDLKPEDHDVIGNAIRLLTKSETKEEHKHYAHYLGVTQFYELCLAVTSFLKETFDDKYGTYLVGSSLTRRDWRDVDVRTIIGDAEYVSRFGEYDDHSYSHGGFIVTFNAAVSTWLSAKTGLPIDYQVQPITKANELYGGKDEDGHKKYLRNALIA